MIKLVQNRIDKYKANENINSLALSQIAIIQKFNAEFNYNIKPATGFEDEYVLKTDEVILKHNDSNTLVSSVKVMDLLAQVLTSKLRLKLFLINSIQYIALAFFILYYVFSNGEVLSLFFVSFVLYIISIICRYLLYINQLKIKKEKLVPLFNFVDNEELSIINTGSQLSEIKIRILLLGMFTTMILFRVFLLAN